MPGTSNRPNPSLPGVRILDFTNLLAGPYPGLLLGFLGAEVIKVESRVQLDAARRPPYAYDDPDSSPVFNTINLNKLSVQLNLKEPQSVDLVHRLTAISDGVVENMRPGVMDRLGLGYRELRKINPTIVYASISGAGATGPESDFPGYAPAFNALAGLGHLTGYGDGPPAELHDSVDARIGSTAAFVILSALFRRLRTGDGQYIDLSSREAITMFTGEDLMDYAMNGRVAHRQSNRSPGMAPHGCYRCKGEDAWVTIAVANDEGWQALCRATGHPDWSAAARFADGHLRQHNQDALDSLVEGWTKGQTPEEASVTLQHAGVAASPSMSNGDLANDVHLNARGAWQEIRHPVMGTQRVQGPPWRLSETPATVRSAAPLLGQHNDYVITELLGAATVELATWVQTGVVK